MCFSATASFVAAGGLAVAGSLSLWRAPSPRHRVFAAIPALFSVQQAVEGVLWLHIVDQPWGKTESPIAWFFLLFALAIWPAWVPSSLAVLESEAWRRRGLLACSVAGGLLGGYLLGCASLRASDACIAYDNLYYWVQVDGPLKRPLPFVYAAITVAPFFFSSVPRVKVFGGGLLVAFFVVGRLYPAGFLSVWCFFAALLSMTVLYVQRPNAEPLAWASRR